MLVAGDMFDCGFLAKMFTSSLGSSMLVAFLANTVIFIKSLVWKKKSLVWNWEKYKMSIKYTENS